MPARVMVIEDEGIIALDIEQCLNEEGYTVCIAANARESAGKVHAFRPDLVLMEIGLKGPIDGIELAKQIQKTSNIGIVYLTVHGERDIRTRADSTRPLGFLLKPFKDSDLKRSIEVALFRRDLRYTAKDQLAPKALRGTWAD